MKTVVFQDFCCLMAWRPTLSAVLMSTLTITQSTLLKPLERNLVSRFANKQFLTTTTMVLFVDYPILPL